MFPKSTIVAVVTAFAFCFSAGFSSAQNVELKRFEYVHPAMGVKFKIVLYANSKDSAEKAIRKSVAQIERLDLLLSDYKSSSEIRKLCASAPHKEWQSVSADLYQILKISKKINQETNGAFDVTIGNISRLWRLARKKKKMPTREKLSRALETVAMDKIELGKNSKVKLTKAELRVDFGAIAKGYAADRVISILKEHGIRSAMVDASGDIVVSQAPPNRNGWRIEVFGLKKGQRHFVEISNQAIATSGDLYQFFELDGKRFSHIVNPATGIGVTGPMSVTVIAKNGATADALASAVSVRFEKDQFKVLEKFPSVESLVARMGKDESKPEVKKTKGFPKLEPIKKR